MKTKHISKWGEFCEQVRLMYWLTPEEQTEIIDQEFLNRKL